MLTKSNVCVGLYVYKERNDYTRNTENGNQKESKCF